MGWKPDWLYTLIFQEIEQIWARALEYTGPDGPPPEKLYIQEHHNPRWCYDQHGVRTVLISEGEFTHGEVRGMFYTNGLFQFSITLDRKLITMSYTLGPRYARSWRMRVVGQRKEAVLEPDETGEASIS